MKTSLVEKLLEKALESENEVVSDCPFEVGSAYLIRTVTYHVLGRVKKIQGNFIVLDEASWVADSGKFSLAIEKGELAEIEYVGKAIVSMTAIVDAYPWGNKIPKETK